MKYKKIIGGFAASVLIGGSLLACGGGSSGTSSTTSSSVISGSAVKGPLDCTVAGATVTATDAAGTTWTGATTNGEYSVTVTNPTYPIEVVFSGCQDSVTGSTQAFPLSTAVSNATQTTANANPISSIAVQTAKEMGGGTIAGMTAANLTSAVNNTLNSFGMASSLPDPMHTAFTTQVQISNLITVSEAVSEVVKRVASSTGTTASVGTIVTDLAVDLKDGSLNGKDTSGLTGTTGVTITKATTGVTSSFGSTLANVLREVAAGTLTISNNSTGTVVTKTLTSVSSTVGAITIAAASQTSGTSLGTNAAAIATAIDAATATNGSITDAGKNASSFKLTSNTISVTDTSGTANVVGTTSTTGVFTANLGTLSGTNMQALVNQTGGTAPTLNFALSNLPSAPETTSTITALVKDGSTATWTSGQRQISATYTINWSSDGTTLTLTAPAGTATTSYYNAAGVAGSATLTNLGANILAITGSGPNTTQMTASITSLLANSTVTAALNTGVTVRNGSFFYQLTFTNFPFVDASGAAISTVQGTFSTN